MTFPILLIIISVALSLGICGMRIYQAFYEKSLISKHKTKQFAALAKCGESNKGTFIDEKEVFSIPYETIGFY